MEKFKPFNLEDISKEEIYENLQRKISESIDYWYRINKAIEEIKKILEMAKDYEMVNLVDRLENILDILRGEDNE